MPAKHEPTRDETTKPMPNGADHDPLAAAAAAMRIAEDLLLPSPDALSMTGEQLIIPVVKKPSDTEFFRTHPSLRLTVAMITVNKGQINAQDYAVPRAAVGIVARHHFEARPVVLYPIVVATRPLTYKLVMVRPPSGGRTWDAYNLGKKRCLDLAVDAWKALRPITGGYEACDPHPDAKFPDPEFPEWDQAEWITRSLKAADLIIQDESHPVFKDILHL